ncbi:MAG: HAD family hydrolase [Candidatus Wallbacteria bacterium]|nr:HAD family hydrolase [Candidatus Wallbacteria bacterium]
MDFKAVIFDLDGTLLNTLDDIADAMNRVLNRMGFPQHETEKYKYLVGEGVDLLVERALPASCSNLDLIAACQQAFVETYSEFWSVKTRPYDGIPELLDTLTDLEMKMAVLSNKNHDMTQKMVRELLPSWLFDMVLGARPYAPKKPNPSSALEIADALRQPLSKIVFLGDSGIDMKTAVGAGMYPVGALWGFRNKDELAAHGAMRMIEKPVDLLKFLLEKD